MKAKLLILVVLVLIPFQLHAAKSSLNKDFVKYAEAALDAIDEVEANFDGGGQQDKAEDSLKKLGAALKKFERLKFKEGSPEKEFMFKASMTHLNYLRVLQIYGLYSPQHGEAKETARDTRELFVQYNSKR